MKTIFLDIDMNYLGWGIVLFVLLFLAGVYATRWILGTDKMIELLRKQNEYSLIQIRLLKKILLDKGVQADEINQIIEKGN